MLDTLVCLAEALQAQGRSDEAHTVVDAAIVLRVIPSIRNGGQPNGYNALGNALRLQGKFSEAVAAIARPGV